MISYSMINDYIDNNAADIFNVTKSLCEIPSMTGNEKEKAVYVKNKIYEYTGEYPDIDEAGNVIYRIKANAKADSLLLTAHIDTVFKDLYEIHVIEKDRKLYAPSIMDNCVNVAALLFIVRMLSELRISPDRDIVFAFTVGEEGTGDLKGMKHFMENNGIGIGQVISVDCSLEKVVNKAVGSKRYKVDFKTEGGHSWSDFGNKSAVLYASRFVESIYKITVPQYPKTTYNVGIIEGGTSVNTIAESASVLVDLRSEDEKCLEKLNLDFFKICDDMKCEGLEVTIGKIGDRPCGVAAEGSELIRKVSEIRKMLGLDLEFVSASTDSNVPLSLGIPAVTFGVCSGHGTHTMNEFLYMDSVNNGIRNLCSLVAKLVFNNIGI